MHSSRMHTGRSLTVCRSLLPGGGYAPGGGVCAWAGGLLPGGAWYGGCLVRGGWWYPSMHPPVNRMTNRCKNITLATTSLRPVIIIVALIELPAGSPHELYQG